MDQIIISEYKPSSVALHQDHAIVAVEMSETNTKYYNKYKMQYAKTK